MRRHLFLLLLCAAPAFAQAKTPALKPAIPVMSPANAYQYALAPYLDARNQPNDLTTQDKWALGVSISRAATLCKQLTPLGRIEPTSGLDLLAFARLCNLGRQYTPARQALVAHLSVPHPTHKQAAELLLGDVLLSLKWPASAEIEADFLMRDYPYSAPTNALIHQIISKTEGKGSSGDAIVRRLTHKQLPFLLHALRAYNETPPANINKKYPPVAPAQAFSDALRCAYQYKLDSKPAQEQALLVELTQIMDSAQYAHSPDLPVMQSDLARYQTVGQPAPFTTLYGSVVIAGHPLHSDALNLAHKTTILMPVALWAPNSLSSVRATAKSFHQVPVSIDAITSFSANTGGPDKPSTAVTQSLQQLQKKLPSRVPLLVLTSHELDSFAATTFPAAILIGPHGNVRFNHSLITTGDLRLLIHAYLQTAETPAPKPKHKPS
jgi:hypothetical protein